MGALVLLTLPGLGFAASGGQASVIGCWLCESEGEKSQMEFREGNVAVFDGETSRYALTDDAIQVETEFGVIEYPYKLEGNSLVLMFPGGFQVPCTKIKCGAGDRSVLEEQQGAGERSERPAEREMSGGGNAHLLQGMFCHWSGSSSSYSGSSYSHSLRVSFDGQGHFTTGSEASFDNPSGLGYGSGGGSGGTYRVVGDQVQLNFGDGSTGVATVYNRAGDGTISELMYDGDLYAPQLCE
jgi:hypothetical protein